MTLLSKHLNETLYPDLVEAGGLAQALAQALSLMGDELTASSITIPGFIPNARVGRGDRFSQVHIAAEKRLFTFDFWFEGICCGHGATDDINEIARAIRAWNLEESKIAVMREQFSFFAPTGKGEAHEDGSLVAFQWEEMLRIWTEHDSDFSPRPLIEAAMQRPELRQLFPYTSLHNLCFSRTTGYPFTCDCPHAVALGGGLFRAHSAKYEVVTRSFEGREYRVAEHEILGEGTVEEVLDLLVANLPPNCGPAVNGTAEDVPDAAGHSGT